MDRDLLLTSRNNFGTSWRFEKTCFTLRRPVKLIFHQEFNAVEQAIYFEKKLKKWSGQKKLALDNGEFDMLQILAECRNVSHSNFKPDRDDLGLDCARPDKN